MAKYREVYITRNSFEIMQDTNQMYEGFVIGLGYAYVGTKVISPLCVLDYFRPFGVPPEGNVFSSIRYQDFDDSPEMVEISLRGATEQFHTVKQGDTLSALARKYKVTVNNLVNWNGIADRDKIFVGHVCMSYENYISQEFAEKLSTEENPQHSQIERKTQPCMDEKRIM